MEKMPPAATAAEIEKATAEAADKAVAADREKRSKVLALDNAKGREALAEHLYATTMSVEEIDAALAKAPKATAAEDDETPDGYARARAAAGGGLAAPEKPPTPAKAKAGWDRAAAAINKRLG